MVLHTTFTGLKLGTTGGTTYDTVSSTGYFPTGDSEIQARGGGLPRLIGYDNLSSEIIQIGAVTDYDHFKIGCNTWPQADYIYSHVMKSTNGAAAKFGSFCGTGQPVWMNPGIPMDQDADWDVRVNTTTASMTNICALYLSYGAQIKPQGGQLVSRQVVLASDDGAYPGYGTAATISDLDPRYNYRVAGMQLGNVEDHDAIGMFLQSPSNNTTVGALTGSWTATTFHPNSIPVWFPEDSIVVSGVETLTVGSFSDIAQKTSLYVYFEKLGGRGGSVKAATTPTRGTGGIMKGGGGMGGMGGLLRGLAGR